MTQRGIPAEAVRVVWDAIALHTTPGIPEHKGPQAALVTAGVELDVLGVGYYDVTEAQRAEVLSAPPRVDFKQQIIQPFGAGIAHKPHTAFGNVKADVLERTLPRYRRLNFCDAILASPFAP